MLATVLISLLIAAICAAVIFDMYNKKKQGKSSCGCGCANCSMSGMCHKNSK